MRTLLLVGIAGFAAWHADAALANQPGEAHSRVERTITVINGELPQDAQVYMSGDDRALTEADYRGRWQGEWNGRWVDADGRAYEGTYEGNYDANRGGYVTNDAPPPPRGHGRNRERVAPRAPAPGTYEAGYGAGYGVDYGPAGYGDANVARRSSADNGVGGAVIGGIVGGVVGNRVAGRHNRTAGTILGAGVGAVAGAVIDQAEDRGRDGYARGDRYRGGDRHHGGTRGGNVRYDYAGYRYGTRGQEHVYSERELSYLCEGTGPVAPIDQSAIDGGLCEAWFSSRGGNWSASHGNASTYTASSGYAASSGGFVVMQGAPTIIEETETTYETVTIPAVTRTRAAPRRVAHRRPAVRRAAPRCTCR